MLLGPTGAGKTTTLRLIAGLETPGPRRDRASAAATSRALPPAARDVAFVFQQYSLYPHLSRLRQSRLPAALAGAARRRRPRSAAQVTEIAELLRIDHKLGNRATQLSGGEMQRVAIGRALVRRPAIYLMDEPLSSLDAKLRAELRLELKRIQLELGATILYVTHDQIEAMTMATASASSKQGGWCRSARRARSTRARATSMSRRGSASRRSTCCRAGCCPDCRRRRRPRRSARAPSI